MNKLLGSQLSAKVQQDALKQFIYRYTKEHVPAWATKDVPEKFGKAYPVQFVSDKEWLANTTFNVNKDGSLSNRSRYCTTIKTVYPDNPELRVSGF